MITVVTLFLLPVSASEYIYPELYGTNALLVSLEVMLTYIWFVSYIFEPVMFFFLILIIYVVDGIVLRWNCSIQLNCGTIFVLVFCVVDICLRSFVHY